jgi:hypothetical protein
MIRTAATELRPRLFAGELIIEFALRSEVSCRFFRNCVNYIASARVKLQISCGLGEFVLQK